MELLARRQSFSTRSRWVSSMVSFKSPLGFCLSSEVSVDLGAKCETVNCHPQACKWQTSTWRITFHCEKEVMRCRKKKPRRKERCPVKETEQVSMTKKVRKNTQTLTHKMPCGTRVLWCESRDSFTRKFGTLLQSSHTNTNS